MKSELRRGPQKKKEVRFASDCRYLPDAERRRRMLLNDITQKIEEIQNATLGEHRIRELNDEINKLLKEKVQWERQIVKLGGMLNITVFYYPPLTLAFVRTKLYAPQRC